ncbi:hypothetical protein [Desulfatibacillum aliphaticivorans]|uniref:hypothetical protein n=1 Tax=Desulfatibacillum aliphaticivorans TaxID=218208 RepID=UPI00042348AB|nr:hypothetical protein [Desulfatibacillum aliphaticivorans]
MSIILGLLGKIIGSSAMGAVTGILGSLASGWLDLKKKRLDYEHEEKMMDREREILAMEIESRSRLANIEAAARVEVSENQAMEASFAADKATYSSGIAIKSGSFAAWLLILADFYRATVRPNLSYAGALMLFWLVWEFLDIIPLDVLLEQKPELFWQVFEYTVTTAVFTVTTVIVWWFSGRPRKFKG